MNDSLEKIPVPPIESIASKIYHRSEFYSGNLMLNRGTLSIERSAYYTDGRNAEASLDRAKQEVTRVILREIYADIRPHLEELLRELKEAPESKRRNRCIALAACIEVIATQGSSMIQ